MSSNTGPDQGHPAGRAGTGASPPGTGRRRWSAPVASRLPGAPPKVLEELRRRAMESASGLSQVDLAGAVRSSGSVMGAASSTEMLRNLNDDIHGLGILEPLARVPGTTDVLIDANGRVWVDGSAGMHLTDLAFGEPEQVRELAVRLAAAGGRRLDDAQPFVDVTLGNYRIHAVLPPISTGGPLISIRVKAAGNQQLQELVPDPAWRAALESVVAAKLNFLVSGGTGAGKTTLLAAMLSRVPEDQRIVVVEDSQELVPAHPHLVGMQSRGGNVEGAGEIGLQVLVRQALRMRPDRLVVGECRGAEVREFLGAMNTGHDGAAGTVHANSVGAVPARLAAMGALAGLDAGATALQAASALDVLIHVSRDRATGQRGPVQLGQLLLAGSGNLAVRMIHDETPGSGDPQALEWFRGRLRDAGQGSPW